MNLKLLFNFFEKHYNILNNLYSFITNLLRYSGSIFIMTPKNNIKSKYI